MSEKIAIVIPSFNEETNIEVMVRALHTVMQKMSYDYSIIFVDDGSSDASLKKLESLSINDNKLFFVALSRNFGHQNALKAGVDIVGNDVDAVITMDGDLQHPPFVIPELIEKWKEGYDVVYTIRDEDKQLSYFKRRSSRWFYKLINKLSDVRFEPGTADFRLMDKKVVSVFSNFTENELFIRGIVSWVGFSQYAIKYKPNQRFSGKSKYTLVKMIRFAIQGITSFSTKPLSIVIVLGLCISFLAVTLYMVYVVCSLYQGHAISGWASLISTVVFFGGLNLVVMGVIGIYVGKLFMQSKGRPNYIIKNSNYKP